VPSSLQVPPNCDLTLGMVCVDKEEPGRCRWRMVADERFTNPAGVIQGGFLAAFCDSAMGAATVTHARGRKVRTANVEMKVSFVAPVRPGAVLHCDAQVVAGSTRVAFTEARVTDGDRLVVTASSTYLLSERPDDGAGGRAGSGTAPRRSPSSEGNGDSDQSR
jgi:uncharacterized protein (TIGR00369 family)